jgi:hypothetical protein
MLSYILILLGMLCQWPGCIFLKPSELVSVGSIGTLRLLDTDWIVQVSIPGGGKRFFSFPKPVQT